jgi:predicted RND superfamily exporter protein
MSSEKHGKTTDFKADPDTLELSDKMTEFLKTNDQFELKGHELAINQYDDYVGKISPIKNSSPREEDSKVLEMFYNSKEQQKKDNRIAQILDEKLDDKDIGNSYNSQLYFKTTDEGQQKMFNSYDYYDDLIKNSSTTKFAPIKKTPE